MSNSFFLLPLSVKNVSSRSLKADDKNDTRNQKEEGKKHAEHFRQGEETKPNQNKTVDCGSGSWFPPITHSFKIPPSRAERGERERERAKKNERNTLSAYFGVFRRISEHFGVFSNLNVFSARVSVVAFGNGLQR